MQPVRWLKEFLSFLSLIASLTHGKLLSVRAELDISFLSATELQCWSETIEIASISHS